jgi:drug/metabolite transporter (DMT)-like permease
MAQAAVVAATLLWSVVPLLTKVALVAFSAPFIGMARLLQAAAMAAVVWPSSWRRAPRAAWLAGLGLGGNYLFYALGLRHTSASATNLIVQIEVVGLLVLARFFLKERLGRRTGLGAALALAGIALVGWGGVSVRALVASESFLGTVLVAVAGLCWSAYAVLHKVALGRVTPNESLLPVFAAAAASCLPFALAGAPLIARPHAAHWLALAALGVPCTGLSYLLLAWGMQRVSASTMGLMTSLLPVFTIIEAHWTLGEPITPYVAAGAAAVVSGVILVSTARAGNRLDTGGGRSIQYAQGEH